MIPALLLAVGVALAFPSVPSPPNGPVAGGVEVKGWVERGRSWWCGLAFLGAVLLVPGALALPAGVAGATALWVVVGRAEPAGERRRRAVVRRDLPHLVDLLSTSLDAGLAVPAALELAATALPGPAADEVAASCARLRLGADPGEVWGQMDGPLAPLARAMARAHSSGASVALAARQLADDLVDQARLVVEDRARAVGVRAAVPLGLCLLPGFLLLGVVPMVAGAVGAVAW